MDVLDTTRRQTYIERKESQKVAKEKIANVANDPTFIKRIIAGGEKWINLANDAPKII